LSHHDLAIVGLARNPVGVFRREAAVGRLEYVHQGIPVAARDLELVQGHEILEIVSQAQADAEVACGFVALDDEARQQIARPMFDGQRVGQTQIVGRNKVRIVTRHGSPSLELQC